MSADVWADLVSKIVAFNIAKYVALLKPNVNSSTLQCRPEIDRHLNDLKAQVEPFLEVYDDTVKGLIDAELGVAPGAEATVGPAAPRSPFEIGAVTDNPETYFFQGQLMDPAKLKEAMDVAEEPHVRRARLYEYDGSDPSEAQGVAVAVEGRAQKLSLVAYYNYQCTTTKRLIKVEEESGELRNVLAKTLEYMSKDEYERVWESACGVSKAG